MEKNTNLAKRLVNALTHAERMPKEEWEAAYNDRYYIRNHPNYEDIIEWTENMLTRYRIEELIADKTIHVGMTKADVRALLGQPDGWGGTSRKYKEPCIWLYGNVEFWFVTKKYRIPYPGPKLHGVYVEENPGTDLEEGIMLLKDYP